MSNALKRDSWVLLRVSEISNARHAESDGKRTRLDVKFCAASSPSEAFWDPFFLTDKAMTRFACMASRAGVERECKSAADVTVAFIAELLGKQVWAFIISDERGAPGALKTDGWKFRSVGDPPEEQKAIDYKTMDEEEIAWEGI